MWFEIVGLASVWAIEAGIVALIIHTRREVRDARAEAATWRSTIIADARAEADAQIAAARAELDARAIELEDRASDLAKSVEMARRGSIGNEAREQKAIEAATVRAGLEAQLGPEIVALLEAQFPESWQRAMQYPSAALTILKPIIALARGQIKSAGESRGARTVTGWR